MKRAHVTFHSVPNGGEEQVCVTAIARHCCVLLALLWHSPFGSYASTRLCLLRATSTPRCGQLTPSRSASANRTWYGSAKMLEWPDLMVGAGGVGHLCAAGCAQPRPAVLDVEELDAKLRERSAQEEEDRIGFKVWRDKGGQRSVLCLSSPQERKKKTKPNTNTDNIDVCRSSAGPVLQRAVLCATYANKRFHTINHA